MQIDRIFHAKQVLQLPSCLVAIDRSSEHEKK
jgi:hypothetical protein